MWNDGQKWHCRRCQRRRQEAMAEGGRGEGHKGEIAGRRARKEGRVVQQ